MGLFFLLTNIAITIIVGVGIHSFSRSIVWAVIGAILLTGSARASPIFSLISYPIIEYLFNHGNLTVYSGLIIGINAIQMIVIFNKAREA